MSWTDRVKKEKYYKESKNEVRSKMQQNDGRLNELVTYCVGTAFFCTLLKTVETRRQ
jgi:hypothetical protein